MNGLAIGASVLFFGRANCAGTDTAEAHLRDLGFAVETVRSAGMGQLMPGAAKAWRGDYIFCFRSHLILRKPMIEAASVAAINFHPAPPEYPGSGCLNFALYENADTYGVTAHLMNEKIDNGRILAVDRFPIEPDDTVDTLLPRTHAHLLDLFLRVTTDIARDGAAALPRMAEASCEEAWRGLARRMRDLDALAEITPDIDADELARRIRAAHTEAFPLSLRLHGHRFVLKP